MTRNLSITKRSPIKAGPPNQRPKPGPPAATRRLKGKKDKPGRKKTTAWYRRPQLDSTFGFVFGLDLSFQKSTFFRPNFCLGGFVPLFLSFLEMGRESLGTRHHSSLEPGRGIRNALFGRPSNGSLLFPSQIFLLCLFA